jgi:hypothetical protein
MAAWNRSTRTTRRWWTLGLCVAGALVVVVLLARSAVGAVSGPIAPWQVAVWTAIGCAVTMAAWRLDDADRPAEDHPARLARLAAAVLWGLLFGLLLARRSGAATLAVLIVTATWSIAGIGRVLRLGVLLQAVIASALAAWRAAATADPAAATQSAGTARPSVAVTGPVDDLLRFQMQRRAAAGGETIEVHARLEFPPGAREAVLHVPLWPALDTDPEVDCEPLNGEDVEIRVTSAERYGIRLEARLPSAAAKHQSILIGLEIRAAAAGGRIPAAA